MRSLVGLATVLLLLAACGVAPDIRISNATIPTLKGQAASFDNIDVDQKAHRLYIADRTDLGVDVFDIKSAQPTFVTTVGLPASPNGLAVAPDLQRVFAGLSDGSVAIIDTEAATPTFLRAVQTGGKEADLLDYAAAGHQVFASNGIDGTITMLDGSSGAIKNHLKVGYALEQPRYNSADRLLYVTSPDAGALFALDPSSGAIRKKIALPGCLPKGLAFDSRDQALIACGASVTAYDMRSGTSQSFTQTGGVDVVTYDARLDRFLVSSPHAKDAGTIAIFGGQPIDLVTSVATPGAGNSAVYDETHGIVYSLDTRPNHAGLASFVPLGSDQLPASFLPALVTVLFMLMVAAGGIFAIARQADPIRRPVIVPKGLKPERR